MRKSFKLIVFISVSAILSLVLALFIAPLRSSFSEYSNRITEKVITSAAVNLQGANNGIGAVNTNRTESTIEVGSVKSANSKGTSSRGSNSGSTQVNNISYSILAYAQRNQLRGNAGTGSTAGSGVLSNSSSTFSSNGIQGSLGINSTPGKNNTNTNSPVLIGFNTLTTDLTVGMTAQGGDRQAGNNPPPEEGEGGGGGPTLPIGDGTSILLIMAVAFVSWKMAARKMSLSTSKI